MRIPRVAHCWAVGTLIGIVATSTALATIRPEPKGEVIGSLPQPPKTDYDVLSWMHEHADVIREKLQSLDVTGLMENIAKVDLLVELAYIKHPPQRSETEREWQRHLTFGEPQDPEAFVVLIPYVSHGARWVEKNGRVVIGYRRVSTIKDVGRDERSEDEVGGQRHVRVDRHVTTTTREVRLGLDDPLEPNDEPIEAPTVPLQVDPHGWVTVTVHGAE